MDEIKYISVILPLKLEWEPCYSTTQKLKSGNRVKVMFARKEYIGIVSDTLTVPDIDPKKIKPIIAVEESLEDILPDEIEFWRRIAQYYMCTIGEVYKAAYPSGKINLEEARAAAREKSLIRKKRLIDSIEIRKARLQDRLTHKVMDADKASDGTKKKASLISGIEKIQEELLRTNNALAKAQTEYFNITNGIRNNAPKLDNNTIELSEAQKMAVDKIYNGFDSRHPVLLHGITGSGKTEIYISLAHQVMSQGLNVLYLVPEIALSRQLEDRLEEHFGENLLTFHSGETASDRMNTAHTVRQLTKEGSKGQYIVLGTRSSLFLPHNNLGLIIVDEEHDSSYKQDSPAPRYNARDAALMLYQLHDSKYGNCNIILGSATPSLEELYNCQTGRHVYVGLSERYHGSESAEIEIIDTRAERRKKGMVGNFSRKLIEHMKRTLEQKGQILILRSRRAWSSAMQCTICGNIEKCPHCNVSLSYHKDTGRLTCHYCGYTRPFLNECSKCHGVLAGIGAGTQKIEEELASLFPDARAARLDSDTAQNKKLETKIIKDFAKGEIDILVGTQMVAKGFDFSNLSLVAVIAADSLLGIQDFRADEKALHLLEQFRGRCGRRDRKGTFIIQTSQPDHPIYNRISSNDTESFNLQLLQERLDFGFPPYSRIIEISVKDSSEAKAERTAQDLAGGLRPHFPNLTGPYSPSVDKVAGQFIRKIRLCLRKDRAAASTKIMLKQQIAGFAKERHCEGQITIDVDPT